MRAQQDAWHKEHASSSTLPSLDSSTPASAVVSFISFLSQKNVRPPLRAVDIGCGKGRNTVFLAEQGFDAYGMDYIPQALERAHALAKEKNVDSHVHLHEMPIDERWPFQDNFFDRGVDNFSSIDIETLSGRKTCRDELLRTLRPGGFALIAVVSIDDEVERELYRTSPGPEPNSVIWPSGKFQKDYSLDELKAFYSAFTLLESHSVYPQATKLGKTYTATNYWLFLQKPM